MVTHNKLSYIEPLIHNESFFLKWVYVSNIHTFSLDRMHVSQYTTFGLILYVYVLRLCVK